MWDKSEWIRMGLLTWDGGLDSSAAIVHCGLVWCCGDMYMLLG